jgi:hypothetical protein
VTAFAPAALLGVLNAHGVDYVVIGGLAVITHGHLRATAEVDVIPRPDRGNTEALADALNELEARLADVDAARRGIERDAATLAQGPNFTLSTRLGDLDVMQDVPGAPPYTQLSARVVWTELDGVAVPIVGREDLLALKRAADRPRDLEDVAVLEDLSP